MRSCFLPVVLFAGLILFLAPDAAAHGGQYTGGGGGAGSPRPGPGRNPRGGGITAGTNPTWRNWWDRNREEFFDVRARREEKSGSSSQEGYDRDALHQPATKKDIREKVLPALEAALTDKSADVRDAGAIAVGRAGQVPSLAALKKLLEDRATKVRQAAIMGIGLLHDPMAEQVLVDLLLSPDTDYKERGMAALALGLSGGQRARDALTRKLGASSPFPRVASVKAREVEGCRALAVGLLGDAIYAGTLATAYKKSKTKDESFHPMTLTALARFSEPAAASLGVKALANRKNDVRRSGAILVGRSVRADDPKTVKKLTRIAREDRDKHTQYFLTVSLGRIGGDEAVAYLRKVFAKGRNREERAFAALALGIARDAASAETLLKALKTERDEALRGAAAIALAILEDDRAGEVLHKIMNSVKNPELRSDLITALAMLDYQKALPDIRKITGGARNKRLVRACGFALAVMQDASSIDLMLGIMKNSGSIQVKGGMATALGRTGDRRAIDRLVKLLKDDSQTDLTRAFAVVALGLIADKAPRTEFSRISIDCNYALTNAQALREVIDIF